MTEDNLTEEEAGTKQSVFNEAGLRMRRIDASDTLIETMWICPLRYFKEFGGYGYQIILTELLSKLSLCWGKLSDDEKEEGKNKRNELLDFIETKEIFFDKTNIGFCGAKTNRYLNFNNWKELRELLFDFQVLLEEYYEKHELAGMNKEKEGGYD